MGAKIQIGFTLAGFWQYFGHVPRSLLTLHTGHFQPEYEYRLGFNQYFFIDCFALWKLKAQYVYHSSSSSILAIYLQLILNFIIAFTYFALPLLLIFTLLKRLTIIFNRLKKLSYTLSTYWRHRYYSWIALRDL